MVLIDHRLHTLTRLFIDIAGAIDNAGYSRLGNACNLGNILYCNHITLPFSGLFDV